MKASPISTLDDSDASYENKITYPFQKGVVPPMKQIDDDYKALKAAVSSGNVANAQTAFSALQKDKKTAVANGTVEATSATSQLGTDFQTLQTALQSGDINKVKDAFAVVDKVVGKAYDDSPVAGQSSTVSSSSAAASTSVAPIDPTNPAGNLLSVQA